MTIQNITFINYLNTTKLIMYIIDYVQTKNKDSDISPSSSLSFSKRKLSVSEDSTSSNESFMMLFKSQKSCFLQVMLRLAVSKLSEIFTALIPRISKDVQLLFTAFGREINDAKKLNFSSTETYKYLLGIYTFTLFFKIISVI